MTRTGLSIYTVPKNKKVDGFELVENFFASDGNYLLEYSELYSKSRGIYQALCILIDDGCLKEANRFIEAHPALLKIPFVTRKVRFNEELGEYETIAGYDVFSPIVLIAPYLIREGGSYDVTYRGRVVYKSYCSVRDIETLYARELLLNTVNLWFTLGLDPIVRERSDRVLYSVMNMGVTCEFASVYMDIILKWSLQSPVYSDQYCEDAFLHMIETYSMTLNNVGALEDKKILNELRYVALCLNTYVKHDGEVLFDLEKVKSGDYGEIETRLKTYLNLTHEMRSGFAYVVQILFMLIRGLDVLSEPILMDIFSIRLLLEIYGLNPIEMLSQCQTEEQRMLLLKIMQEI